MITKKEIALTQDDLDSKNAVLQLLAQENQWDEVRLLLEDKTFAAVADINAPDEHGSTLLHKAVMQNNSLSIIKLLLQSGADPNARNSDGNTPLLLAAKFGQLNAIQFLLNQTNLTLTDNNGNTVLHLLTASGVYHKSIDSASFVSDIIWKLLDQDPTLFEKKNNQGQSAAEYYDGSDLEIRALLFDAQHKQILIEKISQCNHHPFDILDFLTSVSEGDREKVLHLAASQNRLDIVSVLAGKIGRGLFLIKNGEYVDINHQDECGDTLLHEAVRKGQLHIITFFLLHGGDPNIQNMEADTALILATRLGQLGAAKLLLDCDRTNPLCTDSKGNNPLHFLATNRRIDSGDIDVLEDNPLHLVNGIHRVNATDLAAWERKFFDFIEHLNLNRENSSTVDELKLSLDQLNTDADTHNSAWQDERLKTIKLLLERAPTLYKERNKAGDAPPDLARNPRVLKTLPSARGKGYSEHQFRCTFWHKPKSSEARVNLFVSQQDAAKFLEALLPKCQNFKDSRTPILRIDLSHWKDDRLRANARATITEFLGKSGFEYLEFAYDHDTETMDIRGMTIKSFEAAIKSALNSPTQPIANPNEVSTASFDDVSEVPHGRGLG
ncbi:MAG: ankyrin repeat protein 27 isoform [Gammaproteobacteria bacterium]|nr:ankyrin repeat protein 27 isoform [Gammaproteobacteria bacterium]